MVWTAGFEPATTRFQGADSDLTELRPEVEGRGRGELESMNELYHEKLRAR